MSTTRTYVLAAYTMLLGTLAFIGWLHIGQADDVPGAGRIGFVALLSSWDVGFRIARAKPLGRRGGALARRLVRVSVSTISNFDVRPECRLRVESGHALLPAIGDFWRRAARLLLSAT